MNILIISYYYFPSNAVGAKRSSALKKYLDKEGFCVDVITSNRTGHKEDGIFYLGKEKAASPSDTKINGKSQDKIKFKISPSLYFRSIDKTLASSFFWSSIKWIKDSRNRKYDVIIASYKPASNIFLGILASCIFKAPLINEYRDLMSKFGRKKKIFFIDYIDRMLDKQINKFASEIVVVSPSAKKYAEDLYKKDVNLIFNGIDKDNKKNSNKELRHSECLTIFYSGTLSDHRTLYLISEHINKYRDKKNIILKIASKQNPIDYGGNPAFTEWLGLIPLSDVYKYQSESDFLLMIEGMGEDSVENLPAKLYEYLGARKPIIATCNSNSDIISLLRETKSGLNINSYSDFVKSMESEWDLSPNNVKKYNRDFQNSQYLDLINKSVIKYSNHH
jgi:hypothetical protein